MARLSSTISCCCLNRFPDRVPTSSSSSSSSSSTLLSTQYATTSQLARQPRRENSWKNQIVIGMSTCAVAVVVISLNTTTGKIFLGNDHGNIAAAAIATSNHMQHLVTAISEKKVENWSDRQRTCPAWQSNSLETIMPENLPRPSFHRGWSEAGSAGTYSRRISPAVPPPMENIAATRMSTSKCFSL